MDVEREFELKAEMRAKHKTERPTYFYIDPNQFDGDDEASEQARFHDAEVDSRIDVLAAAQTAAQRLANLVGHRVVVTMIIETSSYGREFEEAYTAMPEGGR